MLNHYQQHPTNLKLQLENNFWIQLASARTIHRTQGITTDKLAFDPTGITTHGLVYTALSRVKSIESVYLLNEFTHKNFHVKQRSSG